MIVAGCLSTALLAYFFKPRQILFFLYVCSVLFSILSMVMTGYASIILGLFVSFFSAGAFAITFATCLRGMGEHTKPAAALLTTAAIGGAPLPIIQNAVSNSHGYRYSLCIETALFSVGLLFSLYLNCVRAAREQIDGSNLR